MRLTPPTIPVFLVSLILAGLSLASLYTHIPRVQGFVAVHRYWMVVFGYIVLFAGVVFRRL